MTVFVSQGEGGSLSLAVRATAGGFTGDVFTEVRPGESAYGRPYEWWLEAVEAGSVEIED